MQRAPQGKRTRFWDTAAWSLVDRIGEALSLASRTAVRLSLRKQ